MTGCEQGSGDPPGEPPPLDVILIAAHCLGPDLPVSGYRHDTMPRLDAWLRRARVFTRCRTVSGSTLPACGSILTGQLPDRHGLEDRHAALEVPTLAGLLGGDFDRLAIVHAADEAAPDGPHGHWDDVSQPSPVVPDFDRCLRFRPLDHEGAFAAAAGFLGSRADSDRSGLLFFHTGPPGDLVAGAGVQSLAEDELRARSDRGISELDRRLAKLFGLIDFRRTVVALVGDHGLGLRPRLGRLGHGGRLHDDLLRVPLCLWTPEHPGAPPGTDDRICSTLDVVPTLLAILGRPAAGLPGRSLLEPAGLGHRALTAADRSCGFLPGSLKRYRADRHRVELAAEITWPLKRIHTRIDDVEAEEWYHVANDPGEERELGGLPPPPGLPRLSIVVALDDRREFERHVEASPLFAGGRHQWIVLDNTSNRLSPDICRVYAEGQERAEEELILFAHQDVFFPPGWEQDLAASLARLAEIDPDWGVIGSVGVAADPSRSGARRLVGHWCDPRGYQRLGPFPAAVQSLDELWLGIRRASGLRFDESLPGFHCYGIDLCLTAEARGLRCHAIDAFVWHKYRGPDGALLEHPADSPKIARRKGEAFAAEVQPGYRYVGEKWRARMPFLSTSMRWLDPEDLAFRGPPAAGGGPACGEGSR
jgi:hypothetical protein